MIIIPAVDIKNGRVVRLFKGDFSKESLYKQKPLEAALHWQSEGAELLHIVDLDGALSGEAKNKKELLDIIRNVDIAVEVGGGLRDEKVVDELLKAGAERVILGSKVFSDDTFLDNFEGFLGERVAISIDARFIKYSEDRSGRVKITGAVAGLGWKMDHPEQDLSGLFEKFYKKGVRFINFTSIERDGTLSGPDLKAVGAIAEVVKDLPGMNLIASGGVSSIDDIMRLKTIPGIYGVIVGKALYEGRVDFKQAVEAVKN